MTLRDRIARAVWRAAEDIPWTDAPEYLRRVVYKQADAVLSALPCTLSQLEMIERGEAVVVPVEPTPEMVNVIFGGHDDDVVRDWRDMLAARPKG